MMPGSRLTVRQTGRMRSADHSSRAPTLVPTAATLAAVLTACGTSDPETSEPTEGPVHEETHSSPATPDGETDDAQGERTVDGPADFGDSALGRMNRHVFELINVSEPTGVSDWEDQLDETFTAELPVEDFAEFINQQVQPGAPWKLEEFVPVHEHASLSIISSAAGRFGMELSVDPDTEVINGLLFNPMPEAGEPVDSFDEVTEELDELPVDASMLVVEADEVIYEREPQRVMPVSSTAKLYVLYGLVQAVEAGEADWEDTSVVTDELRSLPSGELQDEDAGYELSVADAARQLIAISDNTATDMIIDYLGRETVEDAVAAAGHHDPSLLSPFLSTGDLFELRWGDPALGEEYVEADEDRRAEILEDLDCEILELDPAELTQQAPSQHGLEWYATAEDLVAVHRALSESREEHPELREILTTNPGLVTEPEDPWWEEVAYKGGSAVEALSGSWTLTDDQGRERTIVVLIHGEDGAEVQTLTGPLFGLAQDAFSLED